MIHILYHLRKILQPSPHKLKAEKLVKKYGTNPEYTKEHLTNLLCTHGDNPLFYTYLEAELGTLQRTSLLMGELSRYFNNADLFKNKRCIDVGCASAHSLIALARGGVSEATGVEILPKRYQKALANLSECPDEFKKNIKIHLDSVLNTSFIKKIGSFDVVFCSDVLEHVHDPALAIENLCSLLNKKEGAFAYINIGNFQHPSLVLNEPHYGFPGMTILPYEVALKYFELCRFKPIHNYDVYYWKTFEEYKNMFKSHGYQCTLINPPKYKRKQIRTEASKIPGAVTAFFKNKGLDDLRDEVLLYVSEYLSNLSKEQPEEAFFHKFGVNYYKLLIRLRP